MSREAMAFIAKWLHWYIQYPKFSYFSLESFDGHLHQLPRCCSDRIVLMEFIYQAMGFNTKFSNKHKPGCHKFQMKLGEYCCFQNLATKVLCEELSHLKLGLYTSRKHFDLEHKMNGLAPPFLINIITCQRIFGQICKMIMM